MTEITKPEAALTPDVPAFEETTPWYTSKTIWGTIITMISSILLISGYVLPADFGSAMLNLFYGAGTLIGGAISLWGRIKASTTITATK